jgi:hypothetical protein
METKGKAFTYLAGIPFLIAVSLLPVVTSWAGSMEDAAPSPPSIATVHSTYRKLPLSFEANQGQWDSAVQFVTRG